jgi:dihydrodipicolinate synthase/N-acetylneuraminate lyase
MLRGAVPAAVTPLREDGERVDLAAVGPYVDVLVGHGVGGVMALGTAGEGLLLTEEERVAVARAFVAAADGRVPVTVHCGAQTTAVARRLAEAAAGDGAAAVSAISPPFFPLDDDALLAHHAAVAGACAPLPYYVYEFAARTGYPVPPRVLAALGEQAPNLRGIKVSMRPLSAVTAYVADGVDVFVGPEELIAGGLAAGARGAVSGLAAAVPEATVAAVALATPEASARAGALRAALDELPFIPALKRVLQRRGVPIGVDVRRPLRGLTGEERRRCDALADAWGLSPVAVP